MLLQFRFENYKSFKDDTVFSMVASEYEQEQYSIHNSKLSIDVLTSAAVYGPNASGKTNLIDAMSFIRYFVINSSKDSTYYDLIPRDAYLLDINMEKAPSVFEIQFLHDHNIYRYGINMEKIILVGSSDLYLISHDIK